MIRLYSGMSFFFVSLSIALLTVGFLAVPERAQAESPLTCYAQFQCPAGFWCDLATNHCVFNGSCGGCTNECAQSPPCTGSCSGSSCNCSCAPGNYHPDECFCMSILV